MRSRHAIVFLLLVLAIVLPAFGQFRSTSRASYSIDGTVEDESNHQPMTGIRVDLKQAEGIPIGSTFTSGGGTFEFVGLGNGSYVVEIDLKDYEPVRQTVDVRNESRYSVNIFLSRSVAIVNSTPNSATISAHQLSVPRKAHDEYDKGMELLYTKSDTQGAIGQFQRAIRDFATYYEAYADMGSAYVRLGDMANAEEALRKSVDISSGRYSVALIMLSGFLNDMKRFEEAVSFARKDIDADSSSTYSWQGPFQLARGLFGLNRLEDAEKSATQARDLNPENPSVYLLLGNIHIQRRNFPALLKDIDAYLKIMPTGPEADQARKMRDDLVSQQRQAEQQASQRSKVDTQNNPVADAASPAAGKEQPPAAAPDPSGLTSLPPPMQSNP